MRRVVVTGLGAVTPLGVGYRRNWQRLLAGHSGVVSVASREPRKRWAELTSTVAGLVPTAGEKENGAASKSAGEGGGQWRPSDWLHVSEQRRMSRFTQYGVAAAEMALEHAGWKPSEPADCEATGVCLGSGLGSLDDFYSTSLAYEQDVRLS
jgi:3-oxoacyl-[acyl-carrier-protein] synthase II